jgi:hypothetical protein
MDCHRIDESGYTGFDLLNREQRFQGAAAVAIENDDAERLIKEHFPRLQPTELKYGALSRRAGNQALTRERLSASNPLFPESRPSATGPILAIQTRWANYPNLT